MPVMESHAFFTVFLSIVDLADADLLYLASLDRCQHA